MSRAVSSVVVKHPCASGADFVECPTTTLEATSSVGSPAPTGFCRFLVRRCAADDARQDVDADLGFDHVGRSVFHCLDSVGPGDRRFLVLPVTQGAVPCTRTPCARACHSGDKSAAQTELGTPRSRPTGPWARSHRPRASDLHEEGDTCWSARMPAAD